MPLYVQSNNGAAASASSLAVAFPSSIGTGKRLITLGIFDYRAGTGATRTVSDTLGTIYQQDVVVTLSATIDMTIYSGVAPAAGGANTVTTSYGGVNQTNIVLAVHEYHLMRTANWFDVGTGATGSGTALNSGNLTPNYDNSLIFGWGLGGGTLTAGTNEAFTLREGASVYGSEDVIKGAIGVTSAQFTSGTSGTWLCVAGVYRRRCLGNPSLDGDGNYGLEGAF